MRETGARAVRIALIGDHDEAVLAHRAIPRALQRAAEALALSVQPSWIGTDTLEDPAQLDAFDAVWCVPASPYRDLDGALAAIRYARENHVPFLGTCGGFQHTVLEYARNVLGWADAEHAETASDAARAVIVPLRCALVEVHAPIELVPGSRIAAAYACTQIDEGYHCSYGVADAFASAIAATPLRVSGVDGDGGVRAIELTDRAFFVATLFQPERTALTGRCPPLVRAFVAAARDAAAQRADGSAEISGLLAGAG